MTSLLSGTHPSGSSIHQIGHDSKLVDRFQQHFLRRLRLGLPSLGVAQQRHLQQLARFHDLGNQDALACVSTQDACRWWLSNIVQMGIVAGVGWSIYTDGAKSAALMWSVLAASMFFWLASVAFSFSCLLLTGRYPNEAKFARKSIASVIEQRGASVVNPHPPAWET